MRALRSRGGGIGLIFLTRGSPEDYMCYNQYQYRDDEDNEDIFSFKADDYFISE